MGWISMVISVAALLLSLFNLYRTIVKEKMDMAPLVIIEREEVCSTGLMYIFPDEVPYNKDNLPQITLDNRAFVNKSESTDILCCNSLIIDVRKTSKEYGGKAPKADYELLCFATTTIRNVGYDLISYRFESAIITYKDGLIVELKPDKHCELHTYIKSGETVNLHMSLIFNDDKYALLDKEYITEDFINKKNIFAGNNLLDSYMPCIPERYKKIEFNIITVNKFGKKYKQRIKMIIRDNRYYTISEFCK